MQSVIQKSLDLLAMEREWISRFEKYPREIWDNSEKVSKKINKPKGLSLYTAITDRKNLEYQLRFHGQIVGRVIAKSSYLVLKPEVSNLREYFKDYPLKEDDKEWDWKSKEACEFRSYFNEPKGEVTTNSPERVLENLLLEEFRKSVDKALPNIQPVCLHGMFFQMSTPFSASGKEVKYAGPYGGGIDIMARITTKDNHIRLCVIEIKDGNTPNESQRKAMTQAVAYATFIAKLVTEQPQWWEIFSNHTKEKNNTAKNLDKAHIEVVTIMPAGNSETCEDRDFEIEELGITLHCRSLYYDRDKYESGLKLPTPSGKTLFEFSGTFLEEIKK